MQGILEKLQADAAQMPNRPVYDFLDCAQTPFSHDRVTMGQLYRRAMDLAAELRRRGAKPGDRAIILSLQDAGTVYAVWGCMLAGVVFTVIPPPIDEGKLTRFISVLRSCKPKATPHKCKDTHWGIAPSGKTIGFPCALARKSALIQAARQGLSARIRFANANMILNLARCFSSPRYRVFRKRSRFLTTPNTCSTFARTEDFACSAFFAAY